MNRPGPGSATIPPTRGAARSSPRWRGLRDIATGAGVNLALAVAPRLITGTADGDIDPTYVATLLVAAVSATLLLRRLRPLTVLHAVALVASTLAVQQAALLLFGATVETVLRAAAHLIP